MKKAISPVVATVILIAVTIVIGVAVAGWLMGIWGGLGGTEALKIYPNATLRRVKILRLQLRMKDQEMLN
ncbi:MAG: archaellin/type IV pilin N-terminal domain-containing protein [Acidilobaceae archaeon]